MKDLAAYVISIPDYPKPGVVFKDVTPLLATDWKGFSLTPSCRWNRAVSSLACRSPTS